MASGDTLLILTPDMGNPPGTVYATKDYIIGTSTPAESIPVLDFDQTTAEYMDFPIVLPTNYGGGGLTCTVVSSADTTTGGVRWEIAFRRVQDDAEDLDTTAQTYDFNGVTIATLASAIGEVTYDDITFTNGVDMDSLAAGEMGILRFRRDPANGGDTAAADANLHRIIIKET